jgi:hypothetical protein
MAIRKIVWKKDDAMQQVAVLFARSDSVYKGLPGCDVWDIERDARNWQGGMPVIAHPPCRAWGRMRQFAKPREDEKALSLLAVEHVREFGGVLEHPAESSLWLAARLPRPGEFPDEHGGWTLEVEQFHFGHRAEKATWLYIVGVGPDEVPPIPKRDGRPTHCIRPSKKGPRLPSVPKPEREKTPADFATWLCMLASRCGAA